MSRPTPSDADEPGAVSRARRSLAAEPGEGSTWYQEHVGTENLAAHGTVSEARNTQQDLLQVWRGETNNIVWMSLNGGEPFQLRNPDGSSTATYVSPTVVPYGSNNFMVFHTGDGGDIWYTQVFGDGHNSGTWTNVPGNFTNLLAHDPALFNDLIPGSRFNRGSELRKAGSFFDQEILIQHLARSAAF